MVKIISIDFETYSEAGYLWDGRRWRTPPPGKKAGLSLVGMYNYARHPSTEILSMAYGDNLWVPGMPVPDELFRDLDEGGVISAFNSGFEWNIWNEVGKKSGFPPLSYHQMIDTAALAYQQGAQGSLKDVGLAMRIENLKTDGTFLIKKFSIPRNPTKNNPAKRQYMEIGTELTNKFLEYNLNDVRAEREVLERCIQNEIFGY